MYRNHHDNEGLLETCTLISETKVNNIGYYLRQYKDAEGITFYVLGNFETYLPEWFEPRKEELECIINDIPAYALDFDHRDLPRGIPSDNIGEELSQRLHFFGKICSLVDAIEENLKIISRTTYMMPGVGIYCILYTKDYVTDMKRLQDYLPKGVLINGF